MNDHLEGLQMAVILSFGVTVAAGSVAIVFCAIQFCKALLTLFKKEEGQ